VNDLKRVGILALQGDYSAHAAAILGACTEPVEVPATEPVEVPATEPVEVRHTNQLDSIDGLIMPGGESTTLLNLMNDEPWFEELRRFHRRGGVLFGTCAGAILLAREVTDPEQPSLGLLDVTVQRNAYGRQVDSFETDLELLDSEAPLHAVFIRAPRFSRLGPGVEVLASYSDHPVLVRQGAILAASFHPELTADLRLHRRFLEMIEQPESRVDSRRETTSPEMSGLVAQQRRVPC